MLCTEARELPGVAASMYVSTLAHCVGSQLPQLMALSALRIKQSPFPRGCKKELVEYIPFKANTQDPAPMWSPSYFYYCQSRP